MNLKKLPIQNKLSISLIHILGWILYLTFPYLILDIPLKHIEIRIVDVVVLIFVFYLNTLFLVNRFLLKRKFLLYGVFIVLTLSAVYFYSNNTDPMLLKRGRSVYKIESRYFGQGHRRNQPPFGRGFGMMNKREINLVLSTIMLLGIGTSIILASSYYKEQKQKAEKEAEQKTSELMFLKSQISPHFLFNSLNSLYALALKNSETVPDLILKLSDMMRYMIYDSAANTISLSSELKYIENYISLQQTRFNDKCTVEYSVKGATTGISIAPMLLIPFIENMFKHGIPPYSNSNTLKISISIKDNTLELECINPIANQTSKDHVPGIGLKNIIRRLELLYPMRHILQISELEDIYKVILKLEL